LRVGGVVFVVAQGVVPHVHGHTDGIELARRGVDRLDGCVRRRQQIVPLLRVVKGEVEERVDGGAAQRVDEALLREAPHVGLHQAHGIASKANGALLRGGVMKEQQ
jgi:hypothetical protein